MEKGQPGGCEAGVVVVDVEASFDEGPISNNFLQKEMIQYQSISENFQRLLN